MYLNGRQVSIRCVLINHSDYSLEELIIILHDSLHTFTENTAFVHTAEAVYTSFSYENSCGGYVSRTLFLSTGERQDCLQASQKRQMVLQPIANEFPLKLMAAEVYPAPVNEIYKVCL